MMRHNFRHKHAWKVLWIGLFLLIGSLRSSAQSFAEALRSGQSFEIEWIQQTYKGKENLKVRKFPRFPDQLSAGEYDMRIGLQLLPTTGHGLTARINYISYIEFPKLETDESSSQNSSKLSHPIILDTRFQDHYFHPQLFLFDALTKRSIPISCEVENYQQFLTDFADTVKQLLSSASLVKGQINRLQESSLPKTLEAPSLATFFCGLLKQPIPSSESPITLASQEKEGHYIIDYFRVDYPAKTCILKGQIQSPATNEVSVKFFREGNWLDYWQDSLIYLDEEGEFELSFALDHRKMVSVNHGYQTMRFYFEPGDTLHFRTNANAFYRAMELEGTTLSDNHFLLDFYHQMRGDTLFRRYDYRLLEKEHRPYFQKIRAKERAELSFLNHRAASLRPAFVSYMDRHIRLDYANLQWEAAYRFARNKGVRLEPDLVDQLLQLSHLLYRLPIGKTFDFKAEDFLTFQFYRLHEVYPNAPFSTQQQIALAEVLLSKETFVRHVAMQLFRMYGGLDQLTPSGRHDLSQLIAITKDSQLIQELLVFATPRENALTARGYRALQVGKLAPSWNFEDKEGVKIGLEYFANRKLLLHIGWSDNLDMAMSDIDSFRKGQEQLPEIVHLIAANNKDLFTKSVANKEGLFIYVSQDEMQILKENYFIDNSSNHYFLIGEDAKILANHLDLGTARKLRGTWEKMARQPPVSAWTPAQRLRFWQSLGIGALILLLASAAVLWKRRISMRRDLRQRQLLEMELRGIRSQMNPHFLFNAMSSIQNLIRKKEQEKADLYLGQFAGLMRKTLRNTAEEFIPLSDEIEMLEQYCSLESLRHPFQYNFHLDESIDAHNTYIPSMILQPIIENAIIHGLAPQIEARKLQVQIYPSNLGLCCSITDNGVGILAAQSYTSKMEHQSVGMKLVRQRLELLGLDGQEHLSIVDRSTLNPAASGTIVRLTIPIEQ